MNLLRAASALLMVCCGFCAGDAAQSRLESRSKALRETERLLRRIRQEIAFRREDLSALYEQLCREGAIERTEGGSLHALAPPEQLTREQVRCFAECMAGLGHEAAEQECGRLDYYIGRFDEFLAEAEAQARTGAQLNRRLGLAAGAVAALMLV